MGIKIKYPQKKFCAVSPNISGSSE